MIDKRIIRVGLGVVGVCLLLVVGLRPLASHQLTVQASGTGEGNTAVYLPLVLRMLSPLTTPTPTNTPTATHTPSPTSTSTPTLTPTATDMPTATITPTYTPTPTASSTFTTTRISVASDGSQGNDESTEPSISADGRYVAFWSRASNLVSDDTNDVPDVFVYDRQSEQIRRVSVDSDGAQGNDASSSSSRSYISSDGRYIAFVSGASNLVSGDTNNEADIFVHDQQTGQTSRASISSDGVQGNGTSFHPSISADGRYVAFMSEATNLVSNDTNGDWDIFVHDRQSGETKLVSIATNGVQADDRSTYPHISADGRFIMA